MFMRIYMHTLKTNNQMFALYIIVVCVCVCVFLRFFLFKFSSPYACSPPLPNQILLFQASALESNGFEDNMHRSVRNNNKYGNFRKQNNDDYEGDSRETERTNRWINAFIFNRIYIFLLCTTLRSTPVKKKSNLQRGTKLVLIVILNCCLRKFVHTNL